MTGFTPIFGGSVIYPSDTSFLALTTAIDVDLEWPIEQASSANVVAKIIEVNATAAGVDLNLPDARQTTTGYTSLFNNVGANTFTVKGATGTVLMTVASGEAWQLYLSDNSTEAGTWKVFQYGAGASSANAAALAGAGLKAITTTLNQKMAVQSKAANYPIVDADRAQGIVWTGGAGTFTLPNPATVGADWFVAVRNSGTGSLAVTPAAGTIDGGASKTFSPNNSALIVCDGTNYFTIGFGQAINSVFDFVSIDVAGTGDYTLTGGELNRISYRFTGVLAGNRNIIVPALVQQYWVDNETTGAFTLTIKTALGTGISITQTNRSILYCDGTNVINAETVVASVPVPIAQGGTGAITAAGARTNLDVPQTATVVPVTRTLTAGAGLTGGGDLSANRTFDVGAGTGITVNANDVALDTANTRNTDHTAVTITAGAGLTGGGDISASRTLDVGAGTGITVNANDVALDTANTRNTDHAAVSITGTNSVTGGGAITANQTLQLSGDAASPGNSKYYGTDSGGTKGFFSLPVATSFKLASARFDLNANLQAGSINTDGVTNPSAGQYDVDFTSAGFTQPPAVVASLRDASGTRIATVGAFNITTTGCRIEFVSNPGEALTNCDGSYIAIGI